MGSLSSHLLPAIDELNDLDTFLVWAAPKADPDTRVRVCSSSLLLSNKPLQNAVS